MLTSSTACLGIFCAVLLAFAIWKKNQFHPIIFFLLFAISDVYFPAVYWQLYGQVSNPEWLNLLPEGDILIGVAYYSIFLFIFVFSFLAIEGGKIPQFTHSTIPPGIQTKVRGVLWVLFFLTIASIATDVFNRGGFESWFWSKFVFTPTVGSESEASFRGGLFAWLPLRDAFQAAVGLAFFYRRKLGHPKLFGIFFPAVAILLAMSTFLRGTVLTCAITLIFAEIMRYRVEEGRKRPTMRSSKHLRFLLVILVTGVLSMYVYGAIRDTFRGVAAGVEGSNTELAVPTFFTAGHGLLGVSHILAQYGQSVDFLWGKTYLDMMLLPIPRVIYTSKPDWYGIDDITRGMGWPESTQSAVTMPGEAFANFGLFGLLVAFPLGAAFGWLQRMVRANEIRFLLLGPVVFFQLVSVANWMSFTGIMNAMLLIFLLFTLSAYFVRGIRKNDISIGQRPTDNPW
jgi:hypothetical protein